MRRMYPAKCAPPREIGPHLHAECTRMYPNVPECTRMYPNVPLFFARMYLITFAVKYSKLHQNESDSTRALRPKVSH